MSSAQSIPDKRLRWVFIRPRYCSRYYDPELQEPLGLEYLTGARRSTGDRVLLLDATLEGVQDEKLGRRAAAFQPDIVGFSVMTADELESVRAIHAACSAKLAKRPCLWAAGGNFVSTEPAHAAKALPREMLLVRSEGECALNILADRRRKRDAGAARTITGHRVEELDSLAFPHRDYAAHVLEADWAFNIQGSRGCCGACRYCASPGMAQDGRNHWRGRSVEHVVEEIASLGKHFGAFSFNFIDEDFLGPPRLARKRAEAFAAELRQRGLHISFGIQVRPDSLSMETIDALVDAGLTYVFLGIESDDPADLRRWGRPPAPRVWAFVDHLRRRGVGVGAGVLLFHPRATFAGVRRFAARLRDAGLLNFRSATNRLDAMPGSAFYNEAIRAGDIDPDATGTQPLPFADQNVGIFHDELIVTLEPLGPPSMHAVCELPPLLAQRHRNRHATTRIQRLREFLDEADDTVARVLFALLDRHERRLGDAHVAQRLRAQVLETALRLADGLAREGFATSFDMLRQAIRADSGM